MALEVIVDVLKFILTYSVEIFAIGAFGSLFIWVAYCIIAERLRERRDAKRQRKTFGHLY